MPLGAARITLLARSAVTAEAGVIRRKVGVSAIGNAQVDTAQSKFGGASAIFDGTDDYLALDTDFEFINETEWTVEGWIYRTVNKGDFELLFGDWSQSTAGNRNLFIGLDSDGTDPEFVVYTYDSSGNIDTSVTSDGVTSISNTTWTHFAVVKDATNLTLYIDGVSIDSSSSTTYRTSQTGYTIGRERTTSTYDFGGNIDEFRISNTARYTANFTPSTTPFTNDDNTLLLLHMDGVDGSTDFEDDNSIGWDFSNLVYTGLNFDVSNEDGLPRGIALSAHGEKMYMAGTGTDSLYQYTLSTPWNISTASYDSVTISAGNSVPGTIRFSPDGTKMFGAGGNPTSLDAWNLSTPWDMSTASATSAYDFSPEMTFCNDIQFNLDGTKMFLLAGGSSNTGSGLVHQYSLSTAYDTTSETYDSVTLDHSSQTTAQVSIIFSYDGSKLFLLSRDENIYEYTLPTPYILTGASYNTSYDVSAEHTDSFAITNNLIGNRIYILNEDDQTVYQYSVSNRAEVFVSAEDNAQVDTAQSKFGGASLLVDNTSYLNTVDPINIPTTGDFTVEMWVYFDDTTLAGLQTFFDTRPTNSNGAYITLFLENGELKFYHLTNRRISEANPGAITSDTWHHIALSRSGNDHRMFIDGTQVGSTYTNASTYIDNRIIIGSDGFQSLGNGVNSFVGNIDEVRISNTARYTANFTAPTEPFQNDDNTLLLLHMDGTDGSTTFIDDNGVPPNYDYGA